MKLLFMSLRASQRRSNLKFTWRLLRHSLCSLLATTFLISCSSLDNLLATSTPIALTQTPPPTSTRIWFPASATPSPQPFSLTEKVATPEMRPNIGDILLEDDFSDSTLWDIASSNQASAEIDNNRLILSTQSQVYMLSLRHDLILSNFYAEMTAQPSICKGEDSYGLLIRASAATYYRFVLACNGTVRAERYSSGNRLILEGPFQSGDAPPGAPGNVRMGVWAMVKTCVSF
ncbi:MAG: hypothetical protein HC797_08095 [Anaerolineales bacterium]|nr:hypothetical protein [Anaerolineales bacterium]